jgi:transcriptional regulator with GAF, ATPase, and Fis domain
VDVRVIAATNRDLAQEVERGHFRADLYYRVGVFPLHVPPLRERREDLPALAQHFVTRAARRSKLREPRLTPAALDALSAYEWPGNVRELQHVLERAVILGRGKTLELGELLPHAKTGARPATSLPDEPLPTLAELKRRERALLEAALERAGGKVSGPGGAAELLGVKATTLTSKLEAFGLRGGGKRRVRRTKGATRAPGGG